MIHWYLSLRKVQSGNFKPAVSLWIILNCGRQSKWFQCVRVCVCACVCLFVCGTLKLKLHTVAIMSFILAKVILHYLWFSERSQITQHHKNPLFPLPLLSLAPTLFLPLSLKYFILIACLKMLRETQKSVRLSGARSPLPVGRWQANNISHTTHTHLQAHTCTVRHAVSHSVRLSVPTWVAKAKMRLVSFWRSAWCITLAYDCSFHEFTHVYMPDLPAQPPAHSHHSPLPPTPDIPHLTSSKYT